MSKYNLMDIYEGMSDKEFSAAEEAGRLEKHPEKDKIQKIKDLMSKEKSIKELDSTFKEEDKISVTMRGTKADGPEEATIVMMDPSGVAIVRNKEGQEDEVFIKDMNQIKENKKEEQLKIEEMTRETYNRIDSLIDQKLRMEFIDKFIAIQDDLIEAGDEFDKLDLIDYLATELQKFGARNFEEGKNNKARPGYNADGTPKSNDEMSDDEREAFYNDSDFIDEDESLKEHFGRFMKDYQ